LDNDSELGLDAQPYRLELPTGLQVGSVNAYLFTDPEPVLVDTGIKLEHSWAALEEGLARFGLTVGNLTRVIISHAHVDHYGQAGTIADRSGAEIWISDLGAPWLLEVSRIEELRTSFYRDYFLPNIGLSAEMIALVMAGFEAMNEQADPIPVSRVRTFGIDEKLEMGGRAWRVLHTPGHASMQTCFYDPQDQLLLSADMLLATTPAPVVEGPLDGSRDRVPALPLFLQSLDRLEALEISHVLPGHGVPIGDHRALIARQRARIRRRKEECLAWISAGHHVPLDLLDKMYAHQPPGVRLTAMWMLIGYLDLLSAEGAVRQETIDGVWHYFPNPIPIGQAS